MPRLAPTESNTAQPHLPVPPMVTIGTITHVIPALRPVRTAFNIVRHLARVPLTGITGITVYATLFLNQY